MATYSKGPGMNMGRMSGSSRGARMDGTKPSRSGAGPASPRPLPPRGPGASGMRKANIAPGRNVENGRGLGGGKC